VDSAAKIALGKKLYAALLARDWPLFRSLLTDDATWTLPGDNLGRRSAPMT